MLEPVRTVGRRFETAYTHQPFKYVGVSAFALFKRWLQPDGPHALVEPILNEWRELANIGDYHGPIVLRVFRYAADWNAFGMLPNSYSFAEITKFTKFCNDRNFYVDWTCGDSQVVLPDQAAQQQHLNETCAAMVGVLGFVQTCNEPFKNGIDTSVVKPAQWGTYLRSSGYYTDAGTWDHSQDLDFIDFHPDRSEDGPVAKWVGKLFESGVYLAPFGVPIVYEEPIGADEINKPGRRSNDPLLFRQAGLAIGVVAGMSFHSTAGLSSDGLGPVQRACAANWFYSIARALPV